MVCNNKNNWDFRLCPPLSILKPREHNVSQTGAVPSSGEGAVQWLKLTLSEGLPSHLRTEKDPVSETFCSLVFKILDDGQSKKNSNSEDKKVK
jgi:hypothetical protein